MSTFHDDDFCQKRAFQSSAPVTTPTGIVSALNGYDYYYYTC